MIEPKRHIEQFEHLARRAGVSRDRMRDAWPAVRDALPLPKMRETIEAQLFNPVERPAPASSMNEDRKEIS
jgi:hypothetical protein